MRLGLRRPMDFELSGRIEVAQGCLPGCEKTRGLRVSPNFPD
jgi:hypothetical protein